MLPEHGVSRTLALERSARVRNVACALHVRIPLDPSAPLPASTVIDFDLTGASTPLVLDFAPNGVGRLHSCACNSHDVPADLINGHLIVPPEALIEGRNSLAIDFDAGDAPLNRRDGYVYSIFVPARAHEALPCFDQPDLKARWTLTLEIPAGWVAVSNGSETTGSERGAEAEPSTSLVSFATTEPLPTYLFAFAAGSFSVEGLIRDGRPMRVFHRESDTALAAANLAVIADLHAHALEWLEDYTGIPYPFGSFDVVIVPDFQFGGMEHPGAIFYNAAGVLLEANATRQQQLARAHVIAHETAHLWFGDLVTMPWFDDVWMKEVFANFMAARIVNPSFADLDHELRFLHAHYAGAYDVDRTAGAHPIRQPLDNLLDAGSLYGAIIYLKSPIVLRQLELAIGADTFREGVRQYLRRYAFATASWPDLIAILDAHSTRDLRRWCHDWIEEAGRPRIETDMACREGSIERLSLRTLDPVAGRHRRWPQQLEVTLGYGPRSEHISVDLNGWADVAHAAGRPSPDYVLPNGAGLGYGDVRLDADSREWLADHLPEIEAPLTRASAWLTLWDSMLNAEVAPLRIVGLMLGALPVESNELNTLRILGWLERAFWIFLTDEERARTAPAVERGLRAALDAATSPPLKTAYFRSLRTLAWTPETVSWLRDVWAGTADPGMALGDADRVLLVEELAVRNLPDAPSLLECQIVDTSDEERRAALAFVAPALSSDARVRDGFFETLQTPAHWRREPWVLDGLRWLHHPLRAARSVKYIDPGLRLLTQVQRSGDIFLPKRWADATLSGHGSTVAATAVRGFLDTVPPSFPDALRRVVLASADQLFRASRLRS